MIHTTQVLDSFLHNPFFLDPIGKIIESIQIDGATFTIHLTDGSKIKIGDTVHKNARLTVDGDLDHVVGAMIVRLDDCLCDGKHTFDITTNKGFVEIETNIAVDDLYADDCFEVIGFRPAYADFEGNPIVFNETFYTGSYFADTFYASSRKQDELYSSDGWFSAKLMV